MEISYISAEKPLNDPILKTSEGQGLFKPPKVIDPNVLKTAITTYIKDKSETEFNFYEKIGLATYSYISLQSQISLNEVVRQVFNEPDISAKLGSPRLIAQTQIYFQYNVDKPKFVGIDQNKIHLLVKHEYILKCILRLAGPTGFHTLFPNNFSTWKVSIWNRDSNLQPGDTVLREVNGGVAATIVLYGSSEDGVMVDMIKWLLELFPEHETYGLMDIRGTDTLTAGHVRINRMMSYASSDRNALLDVRDANLKAFSTTIVRGVPSWVNDLPCDNVLSQLYIGKDVCNSDGSRIDFNAICNTAPTDAEKLDPDSRNYCYMNRATFDPRVLTAISGGRRTRQLSRSKRSTRKKKKKNVRKQNRKNTGRTHH